MHLFDFPSQPDYHVESDAHLIRTSQEQLHPVNFLEVTCQAATVPAMSR